MNGRDPDLLAAIILEVWSTLFPRGFPGCAPRATPQDMPDTVLIHLWCNLVPSHAIGSSFFDMKAFVVITVVMVRDAVLDEIQSCCQVQALTSF